MSNFLGIDTSNYTTSVAIYDSETGKAAGEKMLLPVKEGALGLRQSDAVFHHTVQLPEVMSKLFLSFDGELSAVGVSASPRSEDGSYMPCFLSGVAVARSLCAAMKLPFYEFSHQQGHIAAVAFSSGRSDLLEREFIAFHLSGGTTEAVLVKPDKDRIILTEIIAKSLDLKAGQAIDRTGVMLSLKFPCGPALDSLSLKSDKDFSVRASVKDSDCSLSGIENKTREMFENGEKPENIAKFCLQSIIVSVDKMLENIIGKYGNLPVLFSGGVSSNTLLREYMIKKYNAVFSSPVYSADNACGTAYLTSLKYR